MTTTGPDVDQHSGGPSGRQHRSIAAIRGELGEVERHLREVPPHHGGGRADLQDRADALRRELSRAMEARDREQGRDAGSDVP